MKLLKGNVCVSMAYYPQTGGQTKWINQTLQQYMRNDCSYHQDDWFELLPLAELVYNSSTSESSKVFPFYTSYCYQPQTLWPASKRRWDNLDPTSEMRDTHWKATWEEIRMNLLKALEHQRNWYEKGHKKDLGLSQEAKFC